MRVRYRLCEPDSSTDAMHSGAPASRDASGMRPVCGPALVGIGSVLGEPFSSICDAQEVSRTLSRVVHPAYQEVALLLCEGIVEAEIHSCDEGKSALLRTYATQISQLRVHMMAAVLPVPNPDPKRNFDAHEKTAAMSGIFNRRCVNLWRCEQYPPG